MRLIIVSNRAPVNIVSDGNALRFEKSSGGLASGLGAYVDRMREKGHDIRWIGWPGAIVDDEASTGREIEQRFGVRSVFLAEETMENFYQGFCNKTIWPLFHYFPGLAEYKLEYWEHYVEVNRCFLKEVEEEYKPGDVIWVHDYHLMLLPAMIRRRFREAAIGFFLHIPFPSYEIFRMLPNEWRRRLLEGMYGADLIGFHTHDYRSYFLRSTLRILGPQHYLGEVLSGNRLVRADTFPMGIDYAKYHVGAQGAESGREVRRLRGNFKSVKLILSLDRQDYTKGILQRLRGYAHFLEHHPSWRGRVTLIMVVIPSRIGLESYRATKQDIDALVGSINGTYGSLQWTPVLYQYRSLQMAELLALYNTSDVALVTPLRDGMNLIAKEYVAGRTDGNGVLILSEMAGAVEELDEAVIVNPNNTEAISLAILEALEMPQEEQKRRMHALQRRVHDYDVFRWADDFLSTLKQVRKKQDRLRAHFLDPAHRADLVRHFQSSRERLLFLDYDGTLVPHIDDPDRALPPEPLKGLLERLATSARLVIVSGRDKATMEKWFGDLHVDLAAEHGLVYREGKRWRLMKPVRKSWKRKILPVMHEFAAKLPGSRVEEKEYSVAFHYRRSDADFAALRVKELAHFLGSFTANMDVQILYGDKALEVRNAGIDKGVAAMHWLSGIKLQKTFVLAVGNDQTDEDLFRVLPRQAFSVKVGYGVSYALYNLPGYKEVVKLLEELASSGPDKKKRRKPGSLRRPKPGRLA